MLTNAQRNLPLRPDCYIYELVGTVYGFWRASVIAGYNIQAH